MEKFDISTFIGNLGEDLVTIFNRSSQQGIHPDEIGKTKEINIKKQIEALLPNGVAIGRGFVFDSKGNISNQCDLIIYEKDLIPVFVRDSNDEYSYFPCEGVIAVGEIKSTLNNNELECSIQKLDKIKKMQRIFSNSNRHRHYLQTITMCGPGNDCFDPIEKSFDNIFTFIFCKENVISEETLLYKLSNYYSNCMELGIDRIYSLNKPIISRFTIYENKTCLWGNKKGVGFTTVKVNCTPFGVLINDIFHFVQNGRSQSFLLENYYSIGEMKMGLSVYVKK